VKPVSLRLATPGTANPPAGWVVLRPAGCPCCTGRVQLQVNLARLILARRPAGIVLEVADDAHRGGVERALREKPLSDYLVLESDPP